MVMIRAGICECATKLEAANWDKVVVTDQRSRGGDEIVELEEENSKSASGGFCLMGCCVQEVQRSVNYGFFFVHDYAAPVKTSGKVHLLR